MADFALNKSRQKPVKDTTNGIINELDLSFGELKSN